MPIAKVKTIITIGGRRMKRFITAVSALVLIACLAVLPAGAQAASKKKSVYVISSISVTEGGKKTTIKPTYRTDGLLKKLKREFTDETWNETFTYGKKGRIQKHTEKVLSGSHKGMGTTIEYTWKGGRLTKKVELYSEGDSGTTTYTYDPKGRIASSSNGFEVMKYTYKKGHVVKAEGDHIKYSATLDPKGNVKKWNRKYDGQKIGYDSANITYKSGSANKVTRTFKANPMQEKEQKQTFQFKYKKISVPKSLANIIADQQWKLTNEPADSFAW